MTIQGLWQAVRKELDEPPLRNAHQLNSHVETFYPDIPVYVDLMAVAFTQLKSFAIRGDFMALTYSLTSYLPPNAVVVIDGAALLEKEKTTEKRAITTSSTLSMMEELLEELQEEKCRRITGAVCRRYRKLVLQAYRLTMQDKIKIRDALVAVGMQKELAEFEADVHIAAN